MRCRSALASTFTLALLAAGGCNAEVHDPGGDVRNGERDGSAGGAKLADRPGERVLVDETLSVVLTNDGGGYGPTPPAGSTCNGESEYRYDLDRRELTWSECPIAGGSQPWREVSGARTLDRDDHDRVVEVLRAIVVSSEEICGADKPVLTITVKTEGAEQLYTDSFYSCRGDAAPYVDGIDGALSELMSHTTSDPPPHCDAKPTCEVNRTPFGSEAQCIYTGWDCEETTLCGSTIWCGITVADCDYLQQVYKDFLAAHDACSVDADCDVIGDCGPHADFAAIRADAAIEGRKLQLARCGSVYHGPTYEAYCNAGTCALWERPPSTQYGCPPLWDEDAGIE